MNQNILLIRAAILVIRDKINEYHEYTRELYELMHNINKGIPFKDPRMNDVENLIKKLAAELNIPYEEIVKQMESDDEWRSVFKEEE